jgi:hypothetical protein
VHAEKPALTRTRDRYASSYTSAVLEMLHEAGKTVKALETGEHILPRYMHSDIHVFAARVCDELCMLYPGVSSDINSVLRIFKHHLEQRARARTSASPFTESSAST